jgi:hypothetical protein
MSNHPKAFIANNGRSEEVREPQVPDSEIALLQDEVFNVTTILYVLIESTRNDIECFSSTYRELSMGLRKTSRV